MSTGDYRMTEQDRSRSWSGGSPFSTVGHYGDVDSDDERDLVEIRAVIDRVMARHKGAFDKLAALDHGEWELAADTVQWQQNTTADYERHMHNDTGGTPISRSEALQRARAIIDRAERERLPQAVEEIKPTRQWFASAAVMPGRVLVFGLDGDEVCTVCGNLAEEETAEERAQLIAAAPQLLAAIEEALDTFREAPLWPRDQIVYEIIEMISHFEMLVDEAAGE